MVTLTDAAVTLLYSGAVTLLNVLVIVQDELASGIVSSCVWTVTVTGVVSLKTTGLVDVITHSALFDVEVMVTDPTVGTVVSCNVKLPLSPSSIVSACGSTVTPAVAGGATVIVTVPVSCKPPESWTT